MLFRTKITLKVNKSEPYIPCSRVNLNLYKFQKAKFKKILYVRILSFLIIPLLLLYDEYIDRQKLSEKQKTLLRLQKNLSGTDISRPGSRVLRRPGSSLSSIDL